MFSSIDANIGLNKKYSIYTLKKNPFKAEYLLEMYKKYIQIKLLIC